MTAIFISYRREDTAGHAGRLYDRLVERFGRDGVFMDVAGIEAGLDFVEAIDRAVGSCDVLLTMVGRDWLTAATPDGARRLDDPNDFVRLETATALKRNVRVIPVLVEGAAMPPARVLPDDLKSLARRQAVELRDSRWDADVQALIAVLERCLTVGPVPEQEATAGTAERDAGGRRPEESRPTSRRTLMAWVGGVIAVLAMALVVARIVLPPPGPNGPEPASPGFRASITVYPQVLDERDLNVARKIQQALRDAGYGKVQRTEVVSQGRTSGDVRFHPGPDRQAAADVKHIADGVLHKEGHDLSLGLLEVRDVKSGVVELWLPRLAEGTR